MVRIEAAAIIIAFGVSIQIVGVQYEPSFWTGLGSTTIAMFLYGLALFLIRPKKD